MQHWPQSFISIHKEFQCICPLIASTMDIQIPVSFSLWQHSFCQQPPFFLLHPNNVRYSVLLVWFFFSPLSTKLTKRKVCCVVMCSLFKDQIWMPTKICLCVCVWCLWWTVLILKATFGHLFLLQCNSLKCELCSFAIESLLHFFSLFSCVFINFVESYHIFDGSLHSLWFIERVEQGVKIKTTVYSGIWQMEES